MSRVFNGREMDYHIYRLYKQSISNDVLGMQYTNFVEDDTIDCNAAVAVIGDGLGTLGKRLIDAGMIKGSNTA